MLEEMHKMVANFLIAEAEKKRAQSFQNLNSITNLEQWEERKKYIRQRLLISLGGLPERIPGNPVLFNIVERTDYTIENIKLDSLPDISINLNLFIPRKKRYPLPAVVFTTGHLSKTHEMHQYPIIGLVKRGYIVACFDCFGRGERTIGNEHFAVGPLSWLNGRCMNRYFIHDSMQVVDYLYTRSEVDQKYICCAGVSGGGNTAIYHAALDDRVSCIVSICTISSFTDLIKQQYSGCPEYYPIGLLGDGIDIQDIAALIAPRPHLLVGGGKDELNIIQSLEETYEHLMHVYELYKKPHNVAYYVDENGQHGCSREMRKAMFEWFAHFLSPVYLCNHMEDCNDQDEMMEPDTVLNFIGEIRGNLIIYEYKFMEKCRTKTEYYPIKKVLGLDKQKIAYRQIISHTITKKNYLIDEYCIETEKDIYVPLQVFRTDDIWQPEEIILLVEADGMPSHPFDYGILNERVVFVRARVRGTGCSSLGPTIWDNMNYCSADRAIASGAIILGYPLAGQQVYDLLAILEFVRDVYSAEKKVRIQSDIQMSFIAKMLSQCTEFKITELSIGKVCLDQPFRKAMLNPSVGIGVEEEICRYGSIVPGIMKMRGYYEN